MAKIQFDGVGKRYDNGAHAVRDLNLTIEDGEFMVVVGPSGCGKSTALRMAAGLEPITEGRLLFDGHEVNALSARDRDVAMVFQNYALYPHMTVSENIAFPLASRGMAKDEIAQRVARAAETLGLTEYLSRRPKALSGGQRQRVAMGRAIVRDPRLFLMDEPLSNLDAKLRNQMRAEIIGLQKTQGVTTLYVTHDQTEAMTMGDRIAIMRGGVLQQAGAPRDLYDHPANLFVAAFIGSPAMNLFQADLRFTDSGPVLVTSGGTLELGPGAALPARARDHDNRTVVVGLRPEHLSLGDGPGPSLAATLTLTEELPPEKLLHTLITAETPMTDQVVAVAADVDASAVGDLAQDARAHRSRLVARLPVDTPVPASGPLDLRFDPARLHLFDARDGQVIR
ncbi:ABC transporter ATP-binding protein [Mesobacterium pallidum]|uniref:ABC transporter ATP-binding protein n=1 Tax=Mesobacterium pallidum TaxID=2872037 RepID=UPI001EE1E5ED|nr:ATP-binding cassette domain-containing protein [Mesobacterium pallidum]